MGGGWYAIWSFFSSSNLCKPNVPRTPLISASMMIMVNIPTPGGCVTTLYTTSRAYSERPVTANALEPHQVRHATTPNKAASTSDHAPIPMMLPPPTMLITASRVVIPATTPAQPPAMWAAERAESSSMISGHAQFAITAEIVPQCEQQVNKIFGL